MLSPIIILAHLILLYYQTHKLINPQISANYWASAGTNVLIFNHHYSSRPYKRHFTCVVSHQVLFSKCAELTHHLYSKYSMSRFTPTSFWYLLQLFNTLSDCVIARSLSTLMPHSLYTSDLPYINIVIYIINLLYIDFIL